MDRRLLTSFIAVAEVLHFGRAAQKMGLLPAVVSRDIRLLEEHLGVRLFDRTTRQVRLSASGETLLPKAREIVAAMDEAVASLQRSSESRVLRLGAIDSAATGLMPQLLRDFQRLRPDVEISLVEDKTVRLLPRLTSGALDLAIVRPPGGGFPRVHFEFLLDEAVVVALPADHPLCDKPQLTSSDLVGMPLIIPSARNRPHSHRLTQRLFEPLGVKPRIAQQADEKHTIVNLVAAGVGLALVPRWTSRLNVSGAVYRPLAAGAPPAPVRALPLSVAWVSGSFDPVREAFLDMLRNGLEAYARQDD